MILGITANICAQINIYKIIYSKMETYLANLDIPMLGIGISVIAMIVAVFLSAYILKKPEGDETMKEISEAIQDGAKGFLNRQYSTIAIFAVLLSVLLYFTTHDGGFNNKYLMSSGFLIGAALSAMAGYIGMHVSIRANVRTTEAAKKSLKSALDIAFKGGAITGIFVVSLALLGVAGFYYYNANVLNIPTQNIPGLLIGFAFGSSLVSLFARIGGGIYTKAADVGADIVGKVEKNIPEDDPRNPAVIADNVGDNVGDCAGMGADLFETYAATLIAAMILAASLKLGEKAILYPVLLGTVSIVASLISIFFVRLGKNKNIMHALYKGLLGNILLSGIAFYYISMWLLNDINLFYAALTGLALTIVINIITEYYTSTEYAPVKEIAKASQTGAGTNLISGLAVGLQSTFLPVIAIATTIVFAYQYGEASTFASGIYGIAIAAVSMLSVTGMVIALDSYGPITDNAGGIAEMSELPESVRKNTDALDAVGNTTKAVTKGYAIGSAGLSALVLFQAYAEEILLHLPEGSSLTFALSDYRVVVGLFIGGAIPFLFSSFCMEAVGNAASKVVEEVRRQFKEIKGIMEKKAKPDYRACVDIVTKAALQEMVKPGLLAIVSPVLVGYFLGPIALGGLLMGLIISGLLLALQMSTGGGSWDNAKKYIEDGNYGSKGSEAHKAAVVGDTVGDPFKDTAGPALNALIKVINIIAIILAPIIASQLLV